MPRSGLIKSRYSLLCGAAACTLALSVSSPAVANPSGGSVVAGQATINYGGDTTTIEQLSDRAIIEWQDFSISQGELTQFLQNNADAAVLNKVISNLPSNILGSLKANGNVFLINPNGVVIGNGAQINANSFIASTLNIPNADFMAGGDLTFKGQSTAAIINLGEIRAGGGDVYLLARQIKNEGTITALNGEVGLAAGSEIYLSADNGNGRRVTVKANAFAEELRDKIAVENTGAIEAARAILATRNGDIYDLAINNSGTVKATGVSTNPDGTIRLFSAGSESHSAGTVRNSGTLMARKYDGAGGTVEVTGEEITLTQTSLIDVSASETYRAPPVPGSKPDDIKARADNRGFSGGGTVLIGGDYQGGGELQTAKVTTLESGSVIKANAGAEGDGGKIIVWADETTKVSGTIKAKGGSESGNGGFIETSGKQTLKVAGDTVIDVSSPTGKGGQWLLDPTDITITDGGGDVDTATINATLNGGGDVTVTTAGAGADAGNITMTNATIDKSVANNDATFTLRANENITVSNSTINSTSGDRLSVVFNASSDGNRSGYISVTDTTINTNGGNFVAGGGADPLTGAAYGNAAVNDGITFDNADINAGAGNITLTGNGFDDAASSNLYGIHIHSGSALQTTSGAITFNGTGGVGTSDNYGIFAENAGTLITSATGSVSLTGQGGSTGLAGGISNNGVFIQDGAAVTSTGVGASAATITIDGSAGAGEDVNHGFYLRDNGAIVTSVDGDISITGRGASNGAADSDFNYGVRINTDSTISSTGTGADAAKITINGTGGAGEDENRGVTIFGVNALVTSRDGDISITGQGGASDSAPGLNNFGINVFSGGNITSTGTGGDAATITLTGTGGAGNNANEGIRVRDDGTVISSVDGAIYLTGRGSTDGSAGSQNNFGVNVSNGADIISSGTGLNAATITLDGTGGAGEDLNHGVNIRDAGTQITSVDGDISITGQAGSNGQAGSDENRGVQVSSSANIASTGTGANAAKITLNGTGGAGEDVNRGIYITTSALLTSVDGDISITGKGSSNGQVGSQFNQGIFVDSDSDITSTGTGADAAKITLLGTGGAGQSDNYGTYLTGAGTQVTSVDGAISITGISQTNGIAGSASNAGLVMLSGASVSSTGTGVNAATIDVLGVGGAGEDFNHGMFNSGAGTQITSVDGDINIVGRGGSNETAASDQSTGISFNGGFDVISTGTGANAATITLVGTGGNGNSTNYGTRIASAGTQVTSAEGAITITGTGQGSGVSNEGVRIDAGEVSTTAAVTDVILISDDMNFVNAPTISATGDIIVKSLTADTTIGLGNGTGDLNLTNTELGLLNAASNVIIGDSAAGVNIVDVDGVDISAKDYEIYGGSITADNLTNIDGSSSVLTARTGDLTLFENDASSAIGAGILDELKANFKTLVGDLILAPETATDAIGIAGEAGVFSFSQADLSGFTQIGNKLVIGDPTAGAGAVRVGALDVSGETYGIGFYGASINLQGTVQSGADLKLAADSISFNNHDLTAEDDIIITTQNTALDIGVSGGAGAVDVSDLVLGDIFAANDGTGNLIIGDSEAGTGDINIDGLDLSAQAFGLKFYGGRVNLSDAAVSSGADLTLGGDSLLNATAALNAKGFIELAPRTAVTVAIDEPGDAFSYGGVQQLDLSQLNENSDAVGSEGLILGSAASGNTTWISTTHDVSTIDARSGANLILQNPNAAASYGLGNGTGGDITFTTAQLQNMTIGNQLVVGDAAAGTGTIDIADLSAADLNYGLDANGGSIAIGGWDADTKNINLNARTGNITTASGLITGGDLTLTAAGDIGTSANRLNTSINNLTYTTGGDLYLNEANALTIANGAPNGAGTVEIITTDGAVTLSNAMNLFGDTLIEAGGANGDINISNALTSIAAGSSTLTLRAGRSIDIVTANETVTNSNGQAFNIVLNADRDANQDGFINIQNTAFVTNGGNFTAGGGASPATTAAWGNATRNDGVTLDNADINTGAGNIAIRGQGRNDFNSNNQYGIYALNGSVLESTTGSITLNGTGGAGNDSNYGVVVDSATTQITSVGGDITITGQGGSNGQTGSSANEGIYLLGGADVTSTGTGVTAGTITLNGTGGAGEDSNRGVVIEGAGTLVSSVDGAIDITGQGGSNGQTGSDLNYGIYVLSDADISSTGTGANAATITLNGTAGAGDDFGYGVYVDNAGTTITSVDGAIDITGQGGSNGQTGSDSSRGIVISGAANITSTGTGSNAATITLDATAGNGDVANYGLFVTGAGTLLSSVDGAIDITGRGGSNGQTGSTNNYGVLVSNDADITSTGTGADAATITVNGTGGAGEDSNFGVYILNTGTQVTSVDGNIAVTGQGGANGQTGSDANYGIYVAADADMISTGTGANAGTITLDGTGGAGGSFNYGVRISDAGTLLTSVDGDISVTGQAGSNGQAGSSNNYGVYVLSDADIISTGTGADAARITLNGTGGAGEDINFGVYVDDAGTLVTSVDGDISMIGQGGSNGQTGSDVNYGVIINAGANVTSTGTGASAADITLTGTGGAGEDNNYGITVEQSGSLITSVDGNIILTGQGGSNGQADSNNNYGVFIVSDADVISTGTGANAATITVDGTGGAGEDTNIGVFVASAGTRVTSAEGAIVMTGQGQGSGSGNDDFRIENGGDISTTAATTDISLTGDTFALSGAPTVSATGTLTIAPRTASTTIGLGGGAGTLNLTDAELAFLTAGTGYIFGDSASGTGAIDIDSMTLAAGQDVTIYGGATDVNGFSGARDILFDTASVTASGGTISATRDITFNVDALTLAAGNASAGRDIFVRPRATSTSIGLGAGAGSLSLNNATVLNLDATDNLVIGYQNTGTGLVSIDNVDVSAKPYDLQIYGGAFNISNGLSVSNDVLLQAHTGNIGVTGAAIQAGGSAVIDAQQGQFTTNLGANVFNITGNYVLYAGDVLRSNVLALEAGADFIYGQTSSSLPAAGLSGLKDFVVLREDFSLSALNAGAFEVSNDLQELSRQPDVLANNFAREPGRVTKAESNQEPFGRIPAGNDVELGGGSVNQEKIKGIGITTKDCLVTASEEIVCSGSKDDDQAQGL